MRTNFFLSIVLLFLLTQCHPAKMALESTAWPQKEEYVVNGKKGLFSKERMQFGSYQTTQVKRSWITGATSRFGLGHGNITDYDYTNIISLDYIKRKQTVKFALTDADNRASEVFCVSNFRATELVIGNQPNSILNLGIDIVKGLLSQPDNKYYVQIYTGRERPWELLLDNSASQMRPKEYIGYLAQGKEKYYTIIPVRHMEGRDGQPAAIPFGSIGFEIRNKEGRAVAAVSKLDRGTVFLQTMDANERFLLANVCTALLLQEVIG